MPRLLTFPFLLVVTSVQPAQDAPPPPTKPPVELLRIECDGPAAWHTKFAPTNLGVMLASEAGGDLWRPHLAAFDLVLRRWLGGAVEGVGAAAARQRWLDYAGRIEFVLWMPSPSPDSAVARPHAVVRLHGDGRTDLEAMAADLCTMWQANAGQAWREQNVGERTWQVLPFRTRQVSSPRRTGDTVVACIGDVEDFAAIERFAVALPAPRPDAASLRLVTRGRDVEKHLTAFDAAIARSWRAFGFGALRKFEFAVGTAGPHVQFEVAAEFDGDERGLFGALFPAATKLPPLLHLVPQDGTPWKIGHFDWSALSRASHASEDAYRGDPVSTSRAETMKQRGIDLDADFLAHLHTDFMMLGVPGWNEKEGFLCETCLVWRTRDDAKVAAGFAAMQQLWSEWIEEERKIEHDGVEIRTYTSLEPLAIAIGRGLCVVAVGQNGPERVIEILDRAKAKALDEPPPAWRSILRYAPPGRNGIAEADMHGLLTRQLPLVVAIMGFVPGDLSTVVPFDDIEAIGKQVIPLLDRFELQKLRTITGYHDGRWAFRAFW